MQAQAPPRGADGCLPDLPPRDAGRPVLPAPPGRRALRLRAGRPRVTTDLERGAYVDPRAGQVTVAAYGAQWRSEQLHRDSTAEFVERAFRLHVDPVIGHLRLGQVRSSHRQAWVKDRSRVLAPSTLRVVYSYHRGNQMG